jgi:phenylacetate-CoA ligase
MECSGKMFELVRNYKYVNKLYQYWIAVQLSRSNIARLENYQDRAFGRLVRSSYDLVPFYRRLYGSFSPVEIREMSRRSEFERLPVTTRELMREAKANELISKGTDEAKLLNFLSSGSTGIPLRTRISEVDGLYRQVIFDLVFFRFNIHPFDRQGTFTLTGRSSVSSRLAQRLGLWRCYAFDVKAHPRETLLQMKQLTIDYMAGFPSLLYLLARENLKEESRRYRLKKAFSWGESIPKEMRAVIEDSFRTRVVDIYGTSEAGLIAHECKNGHGYHITPFCRVEVLRDGKPAGENVSGEIFVTPLHSYAMPFLRYNTGDSGEMDCAPCECGLTSPRLKNLVGRSSGIFVGKDGREFSAMHLYFSWKFLDEVQQFTLVQHEVGRLEIRVVLRPFVDENDLGKRLRAVLASKFQNSFEFTLDFTDRLESDVQRKFIAVRSLLNRLSP